MKVEIELPLYRWFILQRREEVGGGVGGRYEGFRRSQQRRTGEFLSGAKILPREEYIVLTLSQLFVQSENRFAMLHKFVTD